MESTSSSPNSPRNTPQPVNPQLLRCGSSLSIFPVHLNDHEVLFKVASLFGKPIKVNSNTAIGVFPEQPRFCIERDTSLPFPSRLHIRLGSRDLWIPCKFENLPQFCSCCNIFGHTVNNCRKHKHLSLTRKAPAGEVDIMGAGLKEDLAGWTWVKGKRHSRPDSNLGVPTLVPHLLSRDDYWVCKPSSASMMCMDFGKLDKEDDFSSLYYLSEGNEGGMSFDGSELLPLQDSNLLHLISFDDEEQATHCIFSMVNKSNSTIIISSVYGAHTVIERRQLWESLQGRSNTNHNWVVGGDFNAISSPSEYKGQCKPNALGMEEFNSCIEACNLFCPEPSGGLFTCRDSGPSSFRFLNAWIYHDQFFQVVKDCWTKTPYSGGMRGLVAKLKDPTAANRELAEKASAKLLLATHKEVAYWKQKANARWLEFGDSNSKVFHAFANGKRRKLAINHIISDAGVRLSIQSEICLEAASHFSKQFQALSPSNPIHPLSQIPSIITDSDNLQLSRIPSLEEVRQAVWELDSSSASGPDGFNGVFFRTCWDIIKEEMLKASQEFFLGFPIPRAYGSTLISLIPKKDSPKRFDDFRLISLNTFMSKVNTKILSNRLKPLLPKLISSNQAAFQQGISMADHILLALEAAHNLDRKTFGGNMIIKIDIAKAFDTLRWDYLEAILKESGFSRHVISLLLANLKGTMLSVFINRQPTGYFPMFRGVKQGDLGINDLRQMQLLHSINLWWRVYHDNAEAQTLLSGTGNPAPLRLYLALLEMVSLQGSLANIFGIQLKPPSLEFFNGKLSLAILPFQIGLLGFRPVFLVGAPFANPLMIPWIIPLHLVPSACKFGVILQPS
ncbi:unnamed protein product [Cuscuta campestris]|uniref:Reverse transcriptase domain-containing protein n=1 Tax=Cuscuta campestris TaxID=132261 RepID=A0A484LZW4_9ASTE|nr:unnamed protein product [Cuscuta campestris]